LSKKSIAEITSRTCGRRSSSLMSIMSGGQLDPAKLRFDRLTRDSCCVFEPMLNS
jgi:hypothetical protein